MKKLIAVMSGCAMILNGVNIHIPTSAETLTADTQNYYTAWKETYLRKNPYTVEEQYYVFYGEQTYTQANTAVPVTVSEAHGYGMLLAALMSEYDNEAHEIFDGIAGKQNRSALSIPAKYLRKTNQLTVG